MYYNTTAELTFSDRKTERGFVSILRWEDGRPIFSRTDVETAALRIYREGRFLDFDTSTLIAWAGPRPFALCEQRGNIKELCGVPALRIHDKFKTSLVAVRALFENQNGKVAVETENSFAINHTLTSWDIVSNLTQEQKLHCEYNGVAFVGTYKNGQPFVAYPTAGAPLPHDAVCGLECEVIEVSPLPHNRSIFTICPIGTNKIVPFIAERNALYTWYVNGGRITLSCNAGDRIGELEYPTSYHKETLFNTMTWRKEDGSAISEVVRAADFEDGGWTLLRLEWRRQNGELWTVCPLGYYTKPPC